MNRIALKMLIRDRAKYIMLICGLTFCALLITQQSSVFCGIMMWATATIRNAHVPIWVMDANVQQVNDVVAMRQIELDRVRSVPGVDWAVPFYYGLIQARLADGSFQNVQLIGLDSNTLIGRPARMTDGSVEDLRLPNSVVIDQVAIEKFRSKGFELKVGTTFEINDKEARVVGICKVDRSFLGQPYIYTTFERAKEYAPKTRKQLSYILVAPKERIDPKSVITNLNQLHGLRAISEDDFFWETIWWYIKNTGIPIAFGAVVLLGAIVGIAIAGQTFYLFVHENMRYFAALKAMGASTTILVRMVLIQALTVGFIGYGMGVGAASIFGNLVITKGQPPFYMPWQILAFTGGIILLICCVSAVIGLIKVIKLEPSVVFK